MALVLAIGIVVDDAIVMLENIVRRIELGETPLVAAYKGAKQVSFAIIATTVVLVAINILDSMFLGAGTSINDVSPFERFCNICFRLRPTKQPIFWI